MKKKILLVEDEALLAMAKQQELARYNYETSHVTTGEKSVDLVCNQNEPIDLILMDIDLGRGIDGTEAARQILEYKEVPIVFLSSHEEPEIVEKTEKITSYGYVVKSSSITVLDASIKMAFKLYDTKKNLTIHQKTLEQNEKDLKASQHIARLGSWRLDVATNAVTWTEELYKMYGFDPSLPPPPYNKQEEIFTPESWERLSVALAETVKTGKPYTLELEMAKESKSIGWMWVKGEAVQDEAGKTVEIWGAAQDITEKKKVEDALRLSEELLNETGEMVKTGGWEVDVANGKVYWTKATKAIYEVPEDFEPTIEGAMSYFPGESGEKLREAYRRAVEHGVDYDLELDFITAKGNTLKVRDIGRAVFKDGKCQKVYGVFQDITEGKELIKRLENNQNLFKSILRILPGSLNIVDRDFRLLMSNKEQSLINQPETNDNIGSRCYHIFQKQSKPCPWCHILDSIQNDSVFEEITDEEDPRTNTTGRYWHIYTIPFKNADGENVGAIEYSHDITEMKNVEQKLKESEEKYKRAQAAAHVGSWEYDIKTNSFWGSEEGKRIYGFHIENDKFTAEDVMKCVIERERVELSMTNLVEHDIPYDIVFTISPRNSKETRTIHSIAVLEKDEDGNPSKVIGTLHDITAIKMMEKKVQESQGKFKAYVENANDIIFNLTLDGNFSYVSPNWTNMLGHAVEEVIGQSFTPYVHPDDIHKNNALFEKVLITGESQSDIEYRIKHKHGHYVWHSSTGAPIKDDSGNVVSFVGIARDITDRKKAEEELEQVLKDKDFLMKELNHRVKNNLNMVSSLISLKQPETENDLSDIQHQINSISLIHEQLYQSESITEISCQDYFEALLDSLFSSFTRGRVRIEKRIEDLYLTTKTAMTLGLIINEIATNAIKYGFTDNEEAVFLIKMEKDIKNSRYELNLSNTGNPFPEDVDIERSNTFGLRLINALVNQLDGTVELQRKPNPIFTIQFPIED